MSNTTWIGNVYGVITQSGTTAPVVVSDDGQLGTIVSSERFKDEVKPMDKASEAILALEPVTFHYKKSLIRMASRNLASWLSKWKRLGPIWSRVTRKEGPIACAMKQ